MKGFISLIFLISLLAFACVKRKTKNPIPAIVYKDLYNLQKSQYTGQDTAVMILGYEDGDGDIFMDNTNQGPNFIFIPYFYNADLQEFEIELDPITQDTFRITNTIRQPDNGYYKGKSIKGEIMVPLREYRPNDQKKILKFTGYVVDVKGNRSNIVSSPVYTLNF
jgi:hypothetical protein